ncbi:uncharacterized protein C2orf42-like [Saccoglossus kowalevskii]|uniref:Uncharacterized protein C2orf42-like n=1 Tax=Saccoglossus kowalevskii TaxID=10224 RepID=A0ABM0GRN5_SACKO|nr:PREDICTED: uncharacterized protein C2orf42-like [Saccoglossus kowalevskii]
MASVTEKPKITFEDLGRPTLRGVKRCHKCGTYNGTRGLSCKNKTCNAVFKDRQRRGGHSAEAVKIITGSTVQVFSVRLRDRGPDYRGFVQLPLPPELDPTQAVDSTIMGPGRCFVDACQKPVPQGGVLETPCNHIKVAVQCTQDAVPLTLKNSVLNSLPVSNEVKQAIWLLATETTGPLVQRVTKNIMVVKCKTNPKQPLGFLHFSFTENVKKGGIVDRKFHCTCRAFKNLKNMGQIEEHKRRCVHFYACICAFASDDKLAEEFAYYINLDSQIPERQIVTVYTDANDGVTVVEAAVDSPSKVLKKRKRDESMVQASSALLTLQDSANTPNKKSPIKKIGGSPTVVTMGNKRQPISEEQEQSLSFTEWLGSVTERVNQTMHYQFDGNPEPLVFHVPQKFFDMLQHRLSTGSKKKRLPNSTTAFIRKDALPLGTFSKYTWHINNIIHVKQIFDTLDMPLEITRSFVENRDGSYSEFNVPKVEVETIAEAYRKTEGQPPIKPFELKTYMKVGNTAPDQKEPTPFVIEWIPDILPKSKIGELRIKFEYGHQRNGHIEIRSGPIDAIPPEA